MGCNFRMDGSPYVDFLENQFLMGQSPTIIKLVTQNLWKNMCMSLRYTIILILLFFFVLIVLTMQKRIVKRMILFDKSHQNTHLGDEKGREALSESSVY